MLRRCSVIKSCPSRCTVLARTFSLVTPVIFASAFAVGCSQSQVAMNPSSPVANNAPIAVAAADEQVPSSPTVADLSEPSVPEGFVSGETTESTLDIATASDDNKSQPIAAVDAPTPDRVRGLAQRGGGMAGG